MRSAQLPSDPQELVEAVRWLVERGGAARLTTETIAPANAVTPTDIDLQIWNPDGTPRPGLNAMPWLLDLSTEAQNALNAEVAPAS